ncbi:MAG: DUF2300 domain-containing protein [Gallionella sp.]|nr:DUF2300 domain-containing protein [Gallionella sp.]
MASITFLLMGQAQAVDEATVAWLHNGKVEVISLSSSSDNLKHDNNTTSYSANSKVPLGSLWKLFVYVYLAETHAQEPVYVCAEKSAATVDEERYCCDPGESVTRDSALARSCAPYFSPMRLGLIKNKWQDYWRLHTTAAWLLDFKNLQPETEVALGELLGVLAKISPQGRSEARSAMLETSIQGYGREAWTHIGTGIRYKTYSWHRADGRALGGAAGWLVDGTPFWFGGLGSSRTVLTSWAKKLAIALPKPDWRNLNNGGDASCVDVDFFSRYPLHAVWQINESVPVKSGDLKGRYRLQFSNGNWLNIVAKSDMFLTQNAEGMPRIAGRFAINDYVARVIDREGSASSVQAARALAIAVRSYLVQNAHFSDGCWHITDASNTQRVSPNPPSEGALAAAWFTDEIVLNGATVRYHKEKSGYNRLAWRDVVDRAAEGWNFERILSVSYPQATFATLSGRAECSRLDAAEIWLKSASANWQIKLRGEPGFEAPDVTPRICALKNGNPYSDQQRMRIYVRGWSSLNDRITLAHEYLHLALRFHPNGANEDFIERLARQLIEG